MPVDWPYGDKYLQLGGVTRKQISREDADRQTETLRDQPGVLLADEVGMGKTYVAMAVIASVVTSVKGQRGKHWPSWSWFLVDSGINGNVTGNSSRSTACGGML